MWWISMTAYRRPQYTATVLDALSRVRGIGNCIFAPTVEPGYQAVIDCFDNWNACELRLQVNSHRMGLNKNTFISLTRGKSADFVIHLEDDTVPTEDMLEYFEFCATHLRIDDSLMMATAYNRTRFGTEKIDRVKQRGILTPWLWGTTGTKLKWFLVEWCFNNRKCYSCKFRSRYRRSHFELFPEVSRVQNIGRVDGENDNFHHHVPILSNGKKVQFSLLT